MKINELARPRRAKNTAQVFESYFGATPITADMSHRQARGMLNRVRELIAEHRRTPAFHESENDPAYLKLMMMEQVLRQRLNEAVDASAAAPMASGVAATPDQKAAAKAQQDKMKAAQMQQINKVKDPNIKKALTSATQGRSMTPDQQQALANAALSSGIVHEDELNELSKDTLKSYAKKAGGTGMNSAGVHMHSAGALGGVDGKKSFKKGLNRARGVERAIDRLANESVRHSLRRALTEAELQQAQVVLAAQDLSDRLQKMLEEASSMQVKDLASLVSEIKSEVGVDQATQYQQQVGEILSTLVQALQTAKTGVDSAMGIVTGQDQMAVPGEAPPGEMPPPAPEMGGEMPPPEMGAEAPAPEMPPEEPGVEPLGGPTALGREKR